MPFSWAFGFEPIESNGTRLTREKQQISKRKCAHITVSVHKWENNSLQKPNQCELERKRYLCVVDVRQSGIFANELDSQKIGMRTNFDIYFELDPIQTDEIHSLSKQISAFMCLYFSPK